jgi:uncharacterized glyoxalase superfamily protein PhnB
MLRMSEFAKDCISTVIPGLRYRNALAAHRKLMAQPDEIGMRETQSAYLVVRDAEAVDASAKAAGATMGMDIADISYGGRAFTCRDPEHLWSIGTNDPWATHG